MRRRRARDDFSPRETLSPIFAPATNHASEGTHKPHTVVLKQCFKCFRRFRYVDYRLPLLTPSRPRLSGKNSVGPAHIIFLSVIQTRARLRFSRRRALFLFRTPTSQISITYCLQRSLFFFPAYLPDLRAARRAYASSYFLPCPCFARFCVLVSPLIPITPLYSGRLS